LCVQGQDAAATGCERNWDLVGKSRKIDGPSVKCWMNDAARGRATGRSLISVHTPHTAICRIRHAVPTLHTAYRPSQAVAQSCVDVVAASVDSSPSGRIATRTIACHPLYTSLCTLANHLLQSHILIASTQTPDTSLYPNFDTITQHHPRTPHSASSLHHTHPSASQRP
jgi:hypothetical protein